MHVFEHVLFVQNSFSGHGVESQWFPFVSAMHFSVDLVSSLHRISPGSHFLVISVGLSTH